MGREHNNLLLHPNRFRELFRRKRRVQPRPKQVCAHSPRAAKLNEPRRIASHDDGKETGRSSIHQSGDQRTNARAFHHRVQQGREILPPTHDHLIGFYASEQPPAQGRYAGVFPLLEEFDRAGRSGRGLSFGPPSEKLAKLPGNDSPQPPIDAEVHDETNPVTWQKIMSHV